MKPVLVATIVAGSAAAAPISAEGLEGGPLPGWPYCEDNVPCPFPPIWIPPIKVPPGLGGGGGGINVPSNPDCEHSYPPCPFPPIWIPPIEVPPGLGGSSADDTSSPDST
ncbi:hypothetical protein PG987_009747 [Apiospora arundinis]